MEGDGQVKRLKEQLLTLCAIPSVSGFEEELASAIESMIKDHVDEIERDELGNLIALKRGNAAQPRRLLFDAHIDQIGLMISGIEDNGVLRFTQVGGVNPLTLYGKRVRIFGKQETAGIIGAKPPHLISGEEQKAEPVQELFIDAGYRNRREAQRQVDIGDVVLVDYYVDELLGDHVTGAGLDNKAGVLTLLSAAELLSRVSHYHDVLLLFAVQEEVGLRGARVGGFNARPEAAVVSDVTFADPGEGTIEVKTGKGPVLAKGPNYHPPLVKRIGEIAQREDIPVQEEVEPRPGGTDAYFLQVSRTGVYTAGLFIPLRYMHSPVEVINVKDVYRASKLLVLISQESTLFGEW
jgi:putative aminopeptidase FrvX